MSPNCRLSLLPPNELLMVPPAARKAAPKLLFWAAALFALVMASLPHPPQIPGNPSDKVQHAVAFFTLGLLAARAYPRVHWLRLLLMLSLFGGLVELIQLIPALNRDSDLSDWATDTVATAAALLIARQLTDTN